MSRTSSTTWGIPSDWLQPLLIPTGSIVGAIVLAILVHMGEIRMAVAGTVLSVLFGLARSDMRVAILGLLVYLTFLGDLRRLLVPISGWSGNDPLLLVAPVVTLLLFAGAVISRRISLDTPVAKLVALFMAFMTLQIFNPKQGGLLVGVAGAMLYLVPMLWFWIGRAFADRDLMRTWFFRVMPALALFAALMGLYQVFYGWLPYQLAWFRIAGYSALGPTEDLLRSISIFPNLTEYIQYLGIAIIAGCAAAFKKRWDLLLLGFVLFAAIFLAGSRGPIVKVLLTVSILYTVQGRSIATWAPRLAVTLLLGGVLLIVGLTQAGEIASSGTIANDRVSHVFNRQSELLPSNTKDGGTVAIHSNLFWLGIKWGFQDPLGYGVGSTTLAAKKYGESGGSTEKDLSDMFKSGGVIGGFLYLAILICVAIAAVRFWHTERSLLALTIVGILAFMGLSWLKPGAYVLTPLIWLTIGALDRFTASRNQADSDPSAPLR